MKIETVRRVDYWVAYPGLFFIESLGSGEKQVFPKTRGKAASKKIPVY